MPIEFFKNLSVDLPLPVSQSLENQDDLDRLIVNVDACDFPMLGSVQAGFPSPASDYLQDRINLQTELIKHPNATYFMRSKGESMIGAFIPPDAILVIDRLEKPVHGTIVIAVVDGEYTVKRLSIRNNKKLLLPENPRFKPIEFNEFTQCEIWGVVIHIIINAKTV